MTDRDPGYAPGIGRESGILLALMVVAAVIGALIGYNGSGGEPLVAAVAAVAGALLAAARWALPRSARRAGQRLRGDR